MILPPVRLAQCHIGPQVTGNSRKLVKHVRVPRRISRSVLDWSSVASAREAVLQRDPQKTPGCLTSKLTHVESSNYTITTEVLNTEKQLRWAQAPLDRTHTIVLASRY